MEDYSTDRKYTFGERVENYWYHYKWHNVVALFLIFAIAVIAFSMCSKEEIDVHIVYAGRNINQSQERDAELSLGGICPDYNGDGKSVVALTNIWLLSAEQIEAENAKGQGDVPVEQITSNMKQLDQHVQSGEVIIYFLDPHWAHYLYSENEADNAWLPIADYIPENSGYELYGDYGVYLSSTSLYGMAGLSSMPDDTVICIRKLPLSVFFNKKSVEKNHANNKDFLKILLAN